MVTIGAQCSWIDLTSTTALSFTQGKSWACPHQACWVGLSNAAYTNHAEVITSMSTVGVVDAETIAWMPPFGSPTLPPFPPTKAPTPPPAAPPSLPGRAESTRLPKPALFVTRSRRGSMRLQGDTYGTALLQSCRSLRPTITAQ